MPTQSSAPESSFDSFGVDKIPSALSGLSSVPTSAGSLVTPPISAGDMEAGPQQNASTLAFDWDSELPAQAHFNEKAAGCRSEVGRKCYSLPNRYKWCSTSYCSSPAWPPALHTASAADSGPANSTGDSLAGVSHEIFHKRLSSIITWFTQFTDIQRNRVLSDILDECGASQLHLLSTWLCGDGAVMVTNPSSCCCGDSSSQHSSCNPATTEDSSSNKKNQNGINFAHSDHTREAATNGHAVVTTGTTNSSMSSLAASVGGSDSPRPNHLLRVVPGTSRLHLGCPPNCQDPLSVLPVHVSNAVLSYLDPQSLARAGQVSRVWRWVCNGPVLWHRLALLPRWQLSPPSHEAQLAKHTRDGEVNWKEVVVERWRVRRNWLGAHCHVRTFSGHTEGVTCVQFDQHRIVSASHDNTIKVWSMRTNSQWPVQTLVGHSGRVRCLHLSNNRLVSGAADATIKVWEVEETSEWSSIVCRVTMVGHTDTVRCLQVCCEGTLVVSGSYDNSLRVWRLASGQCERTLLGHAGHVLSLAVVEPLSIIVSGSADTTIKVWSLEGGACLRTLRGHTSAITSLAADAHGIISGSLDSTLRSWDIDTGLCNNTVNWITSEGHTGVVRGVAADEWRVVSASDDRTIKVWERATLRRLVTLRNHTDGVTCLAFNEFLIVSGSYDKTVKLWDFSVC